MTGLPPNNNRTGRYMHACQTNLRVVLYFVIYGIIWEMNTEIQHVIRHIPLILSTNA